MKKMKKTFMLAGLLALVLTVLPGCGKTGSSSENVESVESVESGDSGNSAPDAVTITLSTSGTTAPFSYLDDNNNVVGYDIDVAKAVFEKLPQYKLEIKIVELQSTLAEVDSGRCQISANNWNKTSEREEKYYFSDPILDCRYSAITAADKDISNISTLSDLAGKSTILTAGSNVAIVLEDYNEQNPDKTIEINYSDEPFEKMAEDVQDGKFDFVLYPKVMYDIYQSSYGFDLKSVEIGVDITNSLFNDSPYAYFIISRENEQLLEDVNKTLAELQEDGTIKEISETYFGDDYSASEWYTDKD